MPTSREIPTSEWIEDALRVARAATNGPWDWNTYVSDDRGSTTEISAGRSAAGVALMIGNPSAIRDNAKHIAKFDPPTVIALMEDWLRLREALDTIGYKHDGGGWWWENVKTARAALAKQD